MAPFQAQRLRRISHPLIVPLDLRQNLLALKRIHSLRQRSNEVRKASRRYRLGIRGQRESHRRPIRRAIGQQEKSLHYVAQLPHVAGPRIAL